MEPCCRPERDLNEFVTLCLQRAILYIGQRVEPPLTMTDKYCLIEVQRVFALEFHANIRQKFEIFKDGIKENLDVFMKDQIYVSLGTDTITFFSKLESEVLRAELINRVFPQIFERYSLMDMAVHLV